MIGREVVFQFVDDGVVFQIVDDGLARLKDGFLAGFLPALTAVNRMTMSFIDGKTDGSLSY